MATISKLFPGQVLYLVVRERMGNTTVKIGRLRHIKILEVDPEGNFVIAQYGMLEPRKYNERQVKKWKVKKPEPKRKIFGHDSY